MNAAWRPLSLTVTESTDRSRECWPVSSGVPMAPGQLHKRDSLQLTAPRGLTAPLQWEPLAYWPDGSVKWALLDFQANTRAGANRKYRLMAQQPADPPCRVSISHRHHVVNIHTGALEVALDTDDFRVLSAVSVRGDDGRREVLAEGAALTLRDAAGVVYAATGPVDTTIERRGPMRATVVFRGQYRNAEGQRCCSFTLRLHAFAGRPYLKLEHILLNDNEHGVFTEVAEVALRFELAGGVEKGEIGGAGATRKGETARLLQVDHHHWAASGSSRKQGRRAPGWVQVRGAKTTLMAVVRDFWQQWPQSLQTDSGGITIGLFPALAEDQYAGLEPLEKYYYLFDGANYKLKTGVAKRHEVWLRFGLAEDDFDPEAFAAEVNSPLIAVAPPKHLAATGAMGPLAPAGAAASVEYDAAEAKCFAAYLQVVEAEGFYGLLNWGDWFGERVYNWGNEEYDTQHAFFLQFARTGDPRYFAWGETNARHNMDVDVVHALNEDYLNNWEIVGGYSHPVHVGAVYLHAIGHTGGYFPQEVGKQRWPKAYYGGDPRNLGHLWNEGMIDYYCLTGDPWALEVALQVADNLVAISKLDGFTWWVGVDPHCGRTTGWPLKALIAAYKVSGKKTYLQAAKSIIDLILADQDPHCGGWIYKLYPGHCLCRTPHWGMATFITSVMLNGMISYYEVTADERIPEAISRAADFIINDSWDEYSRRFRYTSCPASALTDLTLVLRSLSFAARTSGNPRHHDVLRKSYARWLQYIGEMTKAGAAFGKAYGYYNRELPHVIADLAALGKSRQEPRMDANKQK